MKTLYKLHGNGPCFFLQSKPKLITENDENDNFKAFRKALKKYSKISVS